MHPIVKTEAKTIESANKALSDETISSISLAGGQIFTQFYSRRRRRRYVHTAKLVAEPRCFGRELNENNKEYIYIYLPVNKMVSFAISNASTVYSGTQIPVGTYMELQEELLENIIG